MVSYHPNQSLYGKIGAWRVDVRRVPTRGRAPVPGPVTPVLALARHLVCGNGHDRGRGPRDRRGSHRKRARRSWDQG